MKAYRLGSVKPDQLHHLVDALVDIMTEKEAVRQEAKKDGDEDDIFACGICKAMWNDPITRNCGHTFCRGCLEKTEPKSCNKCKKPFHSSTRLGTLRTNVLLSQTIEKWFGNELRAVRLKTEGNKLFQSRKFEEAIRIYSKALNHGEFYFLSTMKKLLHKASWSCTIDLIPAVVWTPYNHWPIFFVFALETTMVHNNTNKILETI